MSPVTSYQTEALELRAYSTQAPPSWRRPQASVGRVLCLTHAVSFWGPQHTCLVQHRSMKCSLYPKNSPGTQGPQIISRDRQEVKILTQGWEGAHTLGNMKMIFASQNFLACLTTSQALTRTQCFQKMPPIFHAGSGQPAIPLHVCEMCWHTILLSRTARCPVTSMQLLSGTCVHTHVERQATAWEQQSSLWKFSLALYLLLSVIMFGVCRPEDATMSDASEKI